MIGAGHETRVNPFGQAVLALHTHPEQLPCSAKSRGAGRTSWRRRCAGSPRWPPCRCATPPLTSPWRTARPSPGETRSWPPTRRPTAIRRTTAPTRTGSTRAAEHGATWPSGRSAFLPRGGARPAGCAHRAARAVRPLPRDAPGGPGVAVGAVRVVHLPRSPVIPDRWRRSRGGGRFPSCRGKIRRRCRFPRSPVELRAPQRRPCSTIGAAPSRRGPAVPARAEQVGRGRGACDPQAVIA